MARQELHWSKVADSYEELFVDPFHPEAKNPLLPVLEAWAGRTRTVADLGCGVGPLLPFLAENFAQVHAIDFAPGMLERARKRCAGCANITFHECALTSLDTLGLRVDVAAAINSLVMPDVRDQELSLRQIHELLRPGGRFAAIVPAMDAVHYHTMLLLDRALSGGKPLDAARKNAAYQSEHEAFDFAFGQFRFDNIEQHFWQPFEIRHRWRKAGFRRIRLKKLLLSWEHFSCGKELRKHPPPWDWFVQAEK